MPQAKKLYTLTEVSKETGVSMPTLQRYKKMYQDRIPSVGEGRKQRYPKEALAVFEKIREENVKKRGRPAGGKKRSAKKASAKKKTAKKKTTKKKTASKKTASEKTASKKTAKKKTARKKAGKKTASSKSRTKSKRGGRKKSAAKKKSAGKLLTLLEIGRRTGISYPTLLRYVKLYLDEIPHVGSGRKRRYPPAAVAVFRRLRKASKRGPRGGKRKATASRAATGTDRALRGRLRELEKVQHRLNRQFDEIVKLLKKPIKITVRSD